MTFTILHTNDLHGRLTPGLAARLAELKAERAPALLLDSGDAVECGNVGFRRRGCRAHELMNHAGYDAGALGNREFHFRPAPQRWKLSRAAFPILCANLVAPPGYGGIQPAVVREVDGARVAIVGVLVPMVTAAMAARWLSPARFEPAVDALARVLPTLQAEVTVVLSHLGLERDRELAEAGLRIDLILGGHSHHLLDPPERIGRALVTQNRSHGGTVTVVSVTVGAVEVGANAEVMRLAYG